MLNFDPNLLIPVLTGEQLYKCALYKEKYSGYIFVKNVALIGKKLMRVSGKPQILHKNKLHFAQKTRQSNFLPGALNMVKMGSKIYKYFHHLKIVGVLI